MLGIIGAMEEEVRQLRDVMKVEEIRTKAAMEYAVGTLERTPVVLVRSGIGKVNAAVCTQILVDEFGVDAVINTGIAGSLQGKIDIGDIVLSTDFLHYDMDASVFGYAPGQVPAGKNLISWFLLENGKGYCTHFASAGVMLFRMLGVPARYCEGYKVTGHGERELDVLQKNAHAWVEIFVEQVGWIPVEVTPGYEGGNIPESLDGEPETEEPEQVNPETEAVPETDPGSESGKEESGSVWRTRLLMVGFVILCAVALSGLAVMAWQQFQSRRRRLKRDGTRNTNRTVQICFEEYARIRKQYRDRMAEWPVSEAEEKRCREIYEEAVYSTHRIGKGETESVKKMRNRAIAGCRNRLTGKDRLLFFLRYPKKPD